MCPYFIPNMVNVATVPYVEEHLNGRPSGPSVVYYSFLYYLHVCVICVCICVSGLTCVYKYIVVTVFVCVCNYLYMLWPMY